MVQNKITISESSPSSNTSIMNSLNEWLEETYGVRYNKTYDLYIEIDEYSLYLHMNNSDRPIIIAGQFLNDTSFLNYLKKEMRNRTLFYFPYFISVHSGTESQIDGESS